MDKILAKYGFVSVETFLEKLCWLVALIVSLLGLANIILPWDYSDPFLLLPLACLLTSLSLGVVSIKYNTYVIPSIGISLFLFWSNRISFSIDEKQDLAFWGIVVCCFSLFYAARDMNRRSNQR